MAYIKHLDRTQLRETMYSRWHSPDRALYTEAQIYEIMNREWRPVGYHWSWWQYDPEPMVMPPQALTAEARNSLERLLPF